MFWPASVGAFQSLPPDAPLEVGQALLQGQRILQSYNNFDIPFMPIRYFSYLGIYCIMKSVQGTLKIKGKELIDVEATIVMSSREDEQEDCKIREYLKQVDKKFYYRAIENRKQESRVFPYNGKDSKLFANTFSYVHIKRKKK